MRSEYIFCVDAEEVITTMFWNSIFDHHTDVEPSDKDEIRCAITVFCNDIQNYLMDHFDVHPEEVDHFDLDESDPSKWEITKEVVNRKKVE